MGSPNPKLLRVQPQRPDLRGIVTPLGRAACRCSAGSRSPSRARGSSSTDRLRWLPGVERSSLTPFRGRRTLSAHRSATMANIPFTSNYTDLSSQRGYQFQFFCKKCGNGYMSTFQASKLGTAAAAANAAASLLGGIFGRAAQSAQALQTMAAGPAHDAALDAAVKEISPLFKQCTRCGNWVCGPVCWNEKAGSARPARPTWTRKSPPRRPALRETRRCRRRARSTISGNGTSRKRHRCFAPSVARRRRVGSSAPSAAAPSPPSESAHTAAPKPTAPRSSARSAESRTGADVTAEPRRAKARYALRDGNGVVTREGEAEAVVGDAGLAVGPLSVSYLDRCAACRGLPHRDRSLARRPSRTDPAGSTACHVSRGAPPSA